MTLVLKAPGTTRLKLHHDILLSNFAFVSTCGATSRRRWSQSDTDMLTMTSSDTPEPPEIAPEVWPDCLLIVYRCTQGGGRGLTVCS